MKVFGIVVAMEGRTFAGRVFLEKERDARVIRRTLERPRAAGTLGDLARLQVMKHRLLLCWSTEGKVGDSDIKSLDQSK